MKLLLIDNYDSFTYNLIQLIGKIALRGTKVSLDIKKNDIVSIKSASQWDDIIISPGPGVPKDAGAICEIIQELGKSKKILGICLGMQAIAEVYGGELYQPDHILHGETVRVQPTSPTDRLFSGLENGFDAGLYHSWAVDKNKLPDELKITAFDERGVPMAIRHQKYDVCGVQFHPESFLTPSGFNILLNWFAN
ncbi:MAG: aminodeoxychorismate/anthranilate synthase component II [Lentimicrobium sp.]|jgi:anthranilate synthase component 2|nr:aminodeoxychorismate/anthranilate synthase component II [Lentimicrobium sp.]